MQFCSLSLVNCHNQRERSRQRWVIGLCSGNRRFVAVEFVPVGSPDALSWCGCEAAAVMLSSSLAFPLSCRKSRTSWVVGTRDIFSLLIVRHMPMLLQCTLRQDKQSSLLHCCIRRGNSSEATPEQSIAKSFPRRRVLLNRCHVESSPYQSQQLGCVACSRGLSAQAASSAESLHRI